MLVTYIPFRWEKDSRNSNAIRILKSKGIETCYIMQKLHAKQDGKWCPIDYQKCNEDENDNIWLIKF